MTGQTTNPAYKHLDSKLRVAELSLGQWIAVLVGLMAGVGWGLYLSPLGPSLTLMTSVYIVALPVTATLFASLTEFDPWLVARSALQWRRLDGRFVPGPGENGHGYVVRDDPESGAGIGGDATEIDLESLWDRKVR